MKIGIIGGCQTSGLRKWVEVLMDGTTAQSWHVGVDGQSTVDAITPQLSQFDLIISQIGDDVNCGNLERSQIGKHFPAVIYMPIFAFSGTQPDICGVFSNPTDMQVVAGLMNGLLSSIIVAAHHHGYAKDEVEALYNDLVYSKLGYFDSFEIAKAYTISSFMGSNIDLSGEFETWLRAGAFMYTDNHPHMRVLGALAYHALVAAGLNPKHPSEVAEPFDDLALSIQWPVYPCLARKLGVPARPMFLRSTYDIGPNEQREISLQHMINASYDALDSYDRNLLVYDVQARRAIDTIGQLISA